MLNFNYHGNVLIKTKKLHTKINKLIQNKEKKFYAICSLCTWKNVPAISVLDEIF